MKKWLLPLISIFVIGLLSGCGEQVDEILGKVNQILDQQLEEGESEEASGNTTDVMENTEADNNIEDIDSINNNTNTEDNSDNDSVVEDDGHGHGPDDGQGTTVEELIQSGEYESIDPPNGYPLSLPPADWHLVQMIKDPEDGHEAWEGVFCFNTELESTILNYEDQLFKDGFSVLSEPIDSEDVPDAKHSTKFQYNDSNTTIIGDMNYYIDHYGNPCTKVYFTFE